MVAKLVFGNGIAGKNCWPGVEDWTSQGSINTSPAMRRPNIGRLPAWRLERGKSALVVRRLRGLFRIFPDYSREYSLRTEKRNVSDSFGS